LPKNEGSELILHLSGFPAALIAAAGLTLGSVSIFTPWASKPDFHYYLAHESLFWVRTILQSAMILGWMGTVLHQSLGERKRIANSMWIASCILSFIAVALTLDLNMALYQGAHLCLAGSVVVALGIFFDLSKFEVVIETEKNKERAEEQQT